MQAPAVSPAPAHLAENQREALISLLRDDDPGVYQTVRSTLLSYGLLACQWLHPHLLSNDALMRRRAREIVSVLTRQDAGDRFVAFCRRCGEDLDLEEGAGVLAQTQYPEVNGQAYQALYEAWAADLRDRINFAAEPELVLGTINRYLFTDLGFVGNEEHGFQPDSCYLNRVVDQRTGSPLSLCAIYLFVTRRLRLPVTGIGLPGHFVCRYQSSRKELYIDPFQQGRFLTKNDCIKYLLQSHYGFQEGYLAPVRPRRMLLRMCAGLHQIYTRLEMADQAARAHRYVMALTR
jgi:regulator of sirC expression with transglutaminase-like and TPR domain